MSGKASQALRIKFKRSKKKDLLEALEQSATELYALFKRATEGDCQDRARE